MIEPLDCGTIKKLGWRQGAVLGPKLAEFARERAPEIVAVDDDDWLILTSHDCDIVNSSLGKEPLVEVLHAIVAADKNVDKRQAWGRSPRTLQLAIEIGEEPFVLSCTVHARWTVPREILLQEAPVRILPRKERRVVAEWLAKRYIRPAFPTAFDLRWRSKLKDWQKLLRKHSEWLQGVYLRLSTLDELPDETPYKCHFILAVPAEKRRSANWVKVREEIDQEVERFWVQFSPSIDFAGVELLGTGEITLLDIEPYQRFDADWVSFEDDTSAFPVEGDLTS